MPELDIVFDSRDEQGLVEMIFSMEPKLVPGIDYKEACYEQIPDSLTFKRFRKETTQFFMLHDSYFSSPIPMRPSVRGCYYLGQREGGPTIDFLFSKAYRDEDGKDTLSTGFVSHYPTYWDNISECNLRAPDNLKLCYKKLVAYIRKNSKKMKLGVRNYHIGTHTLENLQKGKVHVPASLFSPGEVPIWD